ARRFVTPSVSSQPFGPHTAPSGILSVIAFTPPRFRQDGREWAIVPVQSVPTGAVGGFNQVHRGCHVGEIGDGLLAVGETAECIRYEGGVEERVGQRHRPHLALAR